MFTVAFLSDVFFSFFLPVCYCLSYGWCLSADVKQRLTGMCCQIGAGLSHRHK